MKDTGVGDNAASESTGHDEGASAQPAVGADARPSVRGKFIFIGGRKVYLRGVTYGTFRPRASGEEYPEPDVVGRDFAQMAASGVNAVRTYTVPPRWLLDLAGAHGLHVLVGLAIERYVGYLSDPKDAPDVAELVRSGVRACAGHPAVFGYALANEIPAPTVRWHGRQRMERYIERLYEAAKDEDPGALVTYVNYPTTEHLQLPFLDFVCFNMYLESKTRFEAYLGHLQNIAGDRPLFLTEIGLDSLRNGEASQARALETQVRASFAAGCAGVFVYAWTDEWHRSGEDVIDWEFGLTRRDRAAKPALAAVSRAFAEVPFPPGLAWPRFSVVVCTYNGSRTIRRCLDGLLQLEYPDFEVIVVNDGSTDGTAAIVAGYPFRLITTKNEGLSNARNTGMRAATGDIVAYIDDDAHPDPQWLSYLADVFRNSTHAGVGGPNIPPLDAGPIEQCVAHAPGNPAHVLLSDHEAEHSPGCNMAIRKSSLEAIGGFDPRFRAAGDDVDVCWRLQERGWTLGFSPAAMVWHHRRGSVRAFWKQQVGYGRAEALLERKWPEKYNALGHLTWSGRVYGNGIAPLLGRPSRIYYGTWGSAPFQPLYQPAPTGFLSMTMMPEWYLVIVALGALSAMGELWSPLALALPLFGFAVGSPLVMAVASAREARFAGECDEPPRGTLKLRALIALLHLLQPLARLWGRLSYGLTPWRRQRGVSRNIPWPRRLRIFTDRWRSPEERLKDIEDALKAGGTVVRRGGTYDRWDLEARGGLSGASRLLMAIEEHGQGRQLVRLRSWPVIPLGAFVLPVLLGALSVGAALGGARWACVFLAAAAALSVLRTLEECATATGAILEVLVRLGIGTP